MTKDLLEHLSIEFKTESGQFLIDCPGCGKQKHCHISPDNGLWHCKVCDGSGNPYQLCRHYKPNMTPKEVFAILDQFGLNNNSDTVAKTQTKPKDLSWLKNRIHSITDEEIGRLCASKGLNSEALRRFSPYVSNKDPVAYLPGFVPGQAKAVGFLRAHLDGELVELASGKKEKYPIVGGSKHGLLGLPWIEKNNPDTLIFCEAWRDALATIALGFYATASTGGASCWRDEWLDVFKGKDVYIIMDTDSAGNGGMVTQANGVKKQLYGASKRAADAISKVANFVKIIILPYKHQEKHGKDVYNYIVTDNHDKNEFTLMLDKAPIFKVVQESVLLLPNDHPDTIADRFEKWSIAKCNVKHKYNSIDGWSIYYKDQYQKVEDEKELEVYVRKFLQQCKFKTKIQQPDGSYKATTIRPDKKHKSPAYINSILRWLRDISSVHLRPSQNAPCSLDDSVDADNVIAAKNCLLDLQSAKTLPISDKFYTFSYLPYDYKPEAISDKWGNFLADISGCDEEIMILLQQWCGYLLMNTNKFQKFLLCVGEGANGKFVFFDTIAAAIGKKNVSNVPLACFIEPHKIFTSYGKMVNMSNENPKNLEANAESVIKEYVGGDKMLWKKMYNNPFSAYPTAKLMFATNILPVIRDPSDGIWRRMMCVPFDVQIPEDKQNKNLAKELQHPDELSGILNWMLEGRQSLLKNDGFINPKKCVEKLTKYREESNTARLFLSEYVEDAFDPDHYIIKADLYAAYQQWCKDNGYHSKGNNHFGQDVKRCFTLSKDSRPWVDGQKKTAYVGIQFQEGAESGQHKDLYT